MILDATSESVGLNRVAAVAIIGAGPAGLTLARELAESVDVLVIEAGGLDVDPQPSRFLDGECIGIDYPLVETRARQFGGSLGLWAGYCAQFDEHDFGQRDWVPHSGWPIGIESIRPYFARTAELLRLGAATFDAHAIGTAAEPRYPFQDERIVPTAWRFGAPTLRPDPPMLEAFEAGKLTTLVNAAVTGIHVDRRREAVTGLQLRTLYGRTGVVCADVVVLACGGLETPRLMLHANVGNANGLVGRYFMEHPHRTIPVLDVQQADALSNWTARSEFADGKEFAFCAGLSARVQEEAEILNARAHAYWTPDMAAEEPPHIGLFLEQAPNPDSRVSLASATDPLGMHRIRLNWRLTDLDWRTYQVTAGEIARAFERHGIGRLRAPIEAVAPGAAPVLHSNHHLGTTRMAASPKNGVVDENCRVHDVGNLYVIGGSIFPTVSWANPTFTVVALALRLAAHLRGRFCVDNFNGSKDGDSGDRDTVVAGV